MTFVLVLGIIKSCSALRRERQEIKWVDADYITSDLISLRAVSQNDLELIDFIIIGRPFTFPLLGQGVGCWRLTSALHQVFPYCAEFILPSPPTPHLASPLLISPSFTSNLFFLIILSSWLLTPKLIAKIRSHLRRKIKHI